MAISVSIPTPLRALTGQKDTVEVEAKDVQAMLATLEKSFPGIHDRLVDEKGEVRRFVNIYVGGEGIRLFLIHIGRFRRRERCRDGWAR